jgi:glycosyltransferase involved in cell wall biosynthesis
MGQPYFSIVIPTYNRSELFPLAVRSILNQTCEDYEVIVSDNASSDATPHVATAFGDPRVRYARTPRHFTIADSWEFARSQATGRFTIMLSDDDALVASALERLRQEVERHGAEFLFSKVVEYKDGTFEGTDRNSVSCPSFSGASRVVSVDEFVRPLCAMQPRFHLHPSAFAFANSVADRVVRRTGRFFSTNGVEYSAWLEMALFARATVHIDLPLTICGHTAKSWTSNISLYNPGKDKIEKLIKDVDQSVRYAPLKNFTMCNLMAEGILLAKRQFPEELAPYDFDEVQYLRRTMKELRKRRSMGVDVAVEMDDLLSYAQKYPALIADFGKTTGRDRVMELSRKLRGIVVSLGGRSISRRLRAYALGRRLGREQLRAGFFARGDDFGFRNIVECAGFIERAIQPSAMKYDQARDVLQNGTVEHGVARP